MKEDICVCRITRKFLFVQKIYEFWGPKKNSCLCLRIPNLNFTFFLRLVIKANKKVNKMLKNKGNNKITELRAILHRESQNS